MKQIPWTSIGKLPVGTRLWVKRTGIHLEYLTPYFNKIQDRELTIVRQNHDAASCYVTNGEQELHICNSEHVDKWNPEFTNVAELYLMDDNMDLFSNKNRKNCWKCGCTTEMKRDFSDMSIHKMCPRCKI